ncbi:putative signal transducing protein [Candidatus Omnitrophota bacterium]
MSDKLVTVYMNLNAAPVEAMKQMLEDHGINCIIKGADSARPYLTYITGVELQVMENDKESAERLIKGADIER